MDKQDFLKLAGITTRRAEYLPVAFVLRGGYACSGYFNAGLNHDLQETCMLFNALLVEFRAPAANHAASPIEAFNDSLEQLVVRHYQQEGGEPEQDVDGQAGTIPLAGVPYEEISFVYPVAHLAALMSRAQESLDLRVPGFEHFRNRDVVVKVLGARLW